MLWLIDGYNLMHLSGALGDGKLTREGFRQRRRRFLNELAASLGPERAARTTVVFDAKTRPADFPLETSYKGLDVIFALDDEDADARIERLIAEHPAPKTLTVVSSDRRVRRAAGRRRAKSLDCEQFLDFLRRPSHPVGRRGRDDAPPPEPDRKALLPPDERKRLEEELAKLQDHPEFRDDSWPGRPLITDQDIAAIQREVDREA